MTEFEKQLEDLGFILESEEEKQSGLYPKRKLESTTMGRTIEKVATEKGLI
jgi:hypothetical protein